MKRRARGAQGMLDSLSDKATPLTTSDALVTGLDMYVNVYIVWYHSTIHVANVIL